MIRRVKRTALSTIKTAGAFGAVSRSQWRRDRLLILAYHGVSQYDEHLWDPDLYVAPDLLNRRLEFLKSSGFNILPLGEAIDLLYSGRLPERSVAITFDQGYVDFCRIAHPILKAHQVPATVYLTTFYSESDDPPPAVSAAYMLWKCRGFSGRISVIPGFHSVDLTDAACRFAASKAAVMFFDSRRLTANQKQQKLETLAAEIGFDFPRFRRSRLLHLMNPDEARAVAAEGVDIQLHTHRHAVPQDEALIRREIAENRERVQAMTRRPADHFCYPNGVYYPELLPWLRAMKIRSATTSDSGLASKDDHPLLLPRFVDHSCVSQLEFEAWASGVGSMLPTRRLTALDLMGGTRGLPAAERTDATFRLPADEDTHVKDGARVPIPRLFASTCVEKHFLQSRGEGPPLRIGVLIDDNRLMAPFAAVLGQIARSNFARVELVLRNESDAAAPATPAASNSRVGKALRMLREPGRRRRLGFWIYSRWDNRRFPQGVELLSPCDCSEFFKGIEQVPVRPIVKGFVHRFPEDVVRLVRDRQIDVLLRFGFNIIRGDILHSARYGMWSYHHGDNDSYRGGPAHFWELYEQNPCSGVVLQVLTEQLDNGLILDKAIASTVREASQAKNRIRPYLMGTHMMIRALHDLHEHGWDAVRGRALPQAEYRGQRKIYRMPTNADMARFAARRTRWAVLRRLKYRGRTYHWRLGWRKADPAGRLPATIDDFSWIESPAGHFYADPFLVNRGNSTWVFFEDYSYHQGRGRLACAELRADGRLGDVIPVLDRARHLSYPFVFEHQGETFMIPESEADGTIDLYRAQDFPYRWEKVKTLIPMAGVDTTIHVQDGKVWLFTTVVDPPGADSSLLLFYADDLFGDWRFHPANPISTDVRVARNGGAFFRMDNHVVRPAQDCSVRYGYALHFQGIETLNTREYRETRLHSLLPSETKGTYAVHSYTRAGGVEIIDGTVLRRV